MASTELELYYERKIRIALDALDELDRLELLPGLASAARDSVSEQKPSWHREDALARAQYAGIRSGQSVLALPAASQREAISKLCDEVEKQINADKANSAAMTAAGKFADLLTKLKATV